MFIKFEIGFYRIISTLLNGKANASEISGVCRSEKWTYTGAGGFVFTNGGNARTKTITLHHPCLAVTIFMNGNSPAAVGASSSGVDMDNQYNGVFLAMSIFWTRPASLFTGYNSYHNVLCNTDSNGKLASVIMQQSAPSASSGTVNLNSYNLDVAGTVYNVVEIY